MSSDSGALASTHSHSLVWVSGWSAVRARLAGTDKDTKWSEVMTDSTEAVASGSLRGSKHALQQCSARQACGSRVTECSAQGLRSPCTRHGVTEFGGKAILRCKECSSTASGDSLAVQLIWMRVEMA